MAVSNTFFLFKIKLSTIIRYLNKIKGVKNMTHFTMQLIKQIEAVSGVARTLFFQKNQRFDGQQQVINLLGKEDGMTQVRTFLSTYIWKNFYWNSKFRGD